MEKQVVASLEISYETKLSVIEFLMKKAIPRILTKEKDK